MKKRIIAICLLAVLALAAFTACEEEKSDLVTTEEAKAIALEDLGVTEEETESVHSHVGQHDGAPCYQIYITVGEKSYEYLISAVTGEILSSGEGAGHSH